MQRVIFVLTAILLIGPFLALLFNDGAGLSAETIRPPAELLDPSSAPQPDAAEAESPSFSMPQEDSIFRMAIETAWEYVEDQYQPTTGLVNSVVSYPYATIWDIGSTLAAYHAGLELGLIGQEDFDVRMSRALATLAELPLFADGAFNKNYQIARGVPIGRNDREVGAGYGWSSTDLGRLLVWLRIVATAHPEHAEAAEAVVERLDNDRIVRDGYLWGADLDPMGRPREYPEGRIGYEQYAAAGFALWGGFADRALSVREHGEEIQVMGVPLLTDDRDGAHLTSEPFLLLGLEVGWWSPHWEDLADRVLEAQQRRFERTGQITIVSEDAVPVAPYYFYYYTLNGLGEDFAVVTLTSPAPLPGPRWVSAKGAFAWYALRPSQYTWRALESILPAADADTGWESGIYEQSGRPTGGENINTAAVILESALYHRARRPLLAAAAD